jgi:hypothetical protein
MIVRTSHDTLASERGQSEPLAALVAVSLVCLAVSSFVVLFTDTLGTTGTDRAVGEPTADTVWQQLSTDGMVESETSAEAALGPDTLPEGYNVAVTVTYVDGEGKRETVIDQTFDRSGSSTPLTVPSDAERVERPVTVRLGPGDKRPGRFVVEVWQ